MTRHSRSWTRWGSRGPNAVPIGKTPLACKPLLAYLENVADIYEALAAPARRAILDALTARDDQTLFELVGRLMSDHQLPLTRQAVSQHLEVLEAADLVVSRREGRYKFHTLNPEPLRSIARRWIPEESP